MIKVKAPDTKRIAAWLAEYSKSKAKGLDTRLKRLWRSAKPIYELCRKKKAGSTDKLRQRSEEAQPMECEKTEPLTSVERELLSTWKAIDNAEQAPT